MSSSKKRVALVGSGNWGSALAKLIGENTMRLADKYEAEVRMWVFEEEVNGRKLTEAINKDHENIKYLPGIKLPPNVIAEPDLVKTVQDADMILFVLPHQFIDRTCKQLQGKIKKGAIACSAIKGLTNSSDDKSLGLISQMITKGLGIECGVLMGANIANEVAEERFCETNIGFKDHKNGVLWKEIVQTPNFRVVVVKDVEQVELCGALKNIVATAAGFIDGLYGPESSNTKAAIIRIGLMEMIKFNEAYFPGGKRDVYFESCGVADLITTCFGGRNRKVAEAFAKNPKRTIEELEKEMLNGQRLQGPQTAQEVNDFLKVKKAEDKFPLFTAVHRICVKEKEPSYIVEAVKAHPEHHAVLRLAAASSLAAFVGLFSALVIVINTGDHVHEEI